MTIIQFAKLCNCNPQTLRYYDRVGLLKPARVDPWSGYRYYDESQALSFIKIKNLQAAGFAISQIRELLDKDDATIYEAIGAKIAELENHLREIKQIQIAYSAEMTDMTQRLKAIRAEVSQSMRDYDPTEEFGIDIDTYNIIVDGLNDFFESMLNTDGENEFDFTEYTDGCAREEEHCYSDLLHNTDYEVVYEAHGWRYVKDFFSDIPALDSGSEYSMEFKIPPEKTNKTAFANTALGLLIRQLPKEASHSSSIGCNVTNTQDDANHFYLLRRR